MTESTSAALADLVRAIAPGDRLVRTWDFDGGLSSEMTGVEVETPSGGRQRLVLRRERSADGPFATSRLAREFRLLESLHRLGVAVPRPRTLDAEHRCAVLDFVEGAPLVSTNDPAGTARVFASVLATIHALDAERPEFAQLPRRGHVLDDLVVSAPEVLDESLREGLVRETVRRHWPPPSPARRALLHGDFWPGNVLWRDNRIVAVIDWEDAAVGDPLADVATTRLDLRFAFGSEAMRAFTDHYLALTAVDITNLPVWDLVAALRPAGGISAWAADWANFGRPDLTASGMRATHAEFLDAALAALVTFDP